MSNSFLKERWQEKSREERGETKKWPVDIWDLEKMIQSAELNKKSKEDLSLVLNWLKDSCHNYVHVCEKWVATRRDLEEEQGDRVGLNKGLEIAEDARRRCHHVIFDNLNILARACAKYGLNTQWRDYFGDEKNQNNWGRLGDWAYEMGMSLTKEEEK